MQDAQVRDALVEVLEDINDQIELIADLAVNMIPPCKVNEVRTMQGDFMVSPLLIAKANVLAAMANQRQTNNMTFVISGDAPAYNEKIARENHEAFVAEAQKPLFDGSTPESHLGHGCSEDPSS